MVLGSQGASKPLAAAVRAIERCGRWRFKVSDGAIGLGDGRARRRRAEPLRSRIASTSV
jgi:hypothetical protein